MMKTLVIAAALAAVVASPALAQTAQRRVTPQQMYQSQYDQTVGRTEQPRATNGNTVYDNNQYLGADPDPNVRLDLRRDYEGRDF
jgi:opacity protein-like surface antigen